MVNRFQKKSGFSRRERDTNTIPCKEFRAGHCSYGSKCRFLHGSETRIPSPHPHGLEQCYNSLKQELKSPMLSCQFSDNLFLYPVTVDGIDNPQWSNQFFSGKTLLQNHQIKRFVNCIMFGVSQELTFINIMAANESRLNTIKIFQIIIDFCRDGDDNFLSILVIFVAFLGHSSISAGPLQSLSNKIYAMMITHWRNVCELYHSWFKKISCFSKFPCPADNYYAVLCMSQVVLPFLDVTVILLTRFVDFKFFIKDCLESLLNEMSCTVFPFWSKCLARNDFYSFGGLQDHGPFETEFSITISKNSTDRIRELLGLIIILPEKNVIQGGSLNFSTTDSAWRGSKVLIPNNEQGDHADIKKNSLVPTMREIMNPGVTVLPGNDLFDGNAHWLTSGPARLVDTHFRLLREDMISTIRDGFHVIITSFQEKGGQFLNAAKLSKETRILIYSNLHIIRANSDKHHGLTFTIGFTSPLRQPPQIVSRTLLGLAWKIDEKYTLKFATATSNASKQHITVKFIDQVPWDVMNQRQRSSPHFFLHAPHVLYEAYRPVLLALQTRIPEDIPFQKYICPQIRPCSDVEVSPPTYSLAPEFHFDLSSLIPENSQGPLRLRTSDKSSADNCRNVLMTKSGLDKDQIDAVLSALRSEFICIQGPPGCGKTYIGTQIVKIILESMKNNSGPILVACYTNHALDQFLERLLDLGIQQIRRIGSRCSPNMEKYMLKREDTDSRPTRHIVGKLYAEIDELVKHCDKMFGRAFAKIKYTAILDCLEEVNPLLKASINSRFQDFKPVGKKGVVTPYEYWLQEKVDIKTTRPIQELLQSSSMWEMSHVERNTLNYYLDREIRSERFSRIDSYHTSLMSLIDQINEIHELSKIDVLRQQQIVGITTTGASINQRLLKALGPRILICEEASEILESHMLGLLQSSVQHVICIGDHFQLRPKIAAYDLSLESKNGSKYSLDLSQFERLQQAQYKFPLYTLQTQRRMRPQISQFVRKTVYPYLKDGPNVESFPSLLGFSTNVVFLDHDSPESGRQLGQTSYSNDFEVQMVVALTQYVISQGYSPGEVTILTPYVGQLLKIRESLSKIQSVVIGERDVEELQKTSADDQVPEIEEIAEISILKDHVRVSTVIHCFLTILPKVDNFQGEENKIIILSLVRNSGDKDKKGDIGFLKTPNRINVMLSRAKHGMIILGQSSLLEKKSNMWDEILQTMRDDGFLKRKIQIYCQKHPDYVHEISNPQELFILSPNGGCTVPCDLKIAQCGHKCPRACHSDDPEHLRIYCPKPCLRLYPVCLHPCKKVCGDKCGKCLFAMGELELDCHHIIKNTPCFEYQELLSAEGKKMFKCRELVSKQLACSHDIMVECFKTDKTLTCTAKCGKTLDCGHECLAKCHDNSKEHPKCKIMCKKALSCSHVCQMPCHSGDCSPCSDTCAMACDHSRCNHPCRKVCHPCIEPCVWECEHMGKCVLPCGAPCIRLPCNKRCELNLSCGHQCPSICGEVCPQNCCQICCTDELKDKVVDLVLFQTYSEINLNDNPIFMLHCGHLSTCETLDGITDLLSYYPKKENGEFPAVSDFTALPRCPECRAPITDLKRYGRIIKLANLDHSEKLFIQEVYRRFDRIRTLNTLPMLHKFLTFVSNPPLQKIWIASHAALAAASKSELGKDLLIPNPPKRFMGEVHILISQFYFRKHADAETGAVLSELEAISKAGLEAAKDAEPLFQEGCNPGRVNFSQLEQIKWGIKRISDMRGRPLSEFSDDYPLLKTVETFQSYIKDECVKMEKELHNLKNTGANSFIAKEESTILNLLEDLKEIQLNPGLRYKPLSVSEFKDVFEGMNLGSGHWYRCPQGHVYTIGECGGAMEEGRCPECNSVIGGHGHVLTSGNAQANFP